MYNVLARYSPIDIDDDDLDDMAIERNMQALSKEIEREMPHKEAVLSLMKQTFASRREYILSDSSGTTTEILKRYPALALPFVVSHYYVSRALN